MKPSRMKTCLAILTLFFCLPGAAAEGPKSVVSKQDLKAAEKEFRNALEFEKSGKHEDALLAATRAAQLVPGNAQYITMLEMLRQQIAGGHLEMGNRLAAAGDNTGAAEQFRIALGIDPQNTFVAQRL